MNKIITLSLLTVGLMADPYFGFGGTLTNKDEGCRAYATALAGYQINDTLAVEGRYSYTMRGDDSYANIYAKVDINEHLYSLIGLERPINAIKADINANLGLGYTLGKVGFELVYKHENTLSSNVVFRF